MDVIGQVTRPVVQSQHPSHSWHMFGVVAKIQSHCNAIKPRAHKQFSFSHRVINNWNELPDSVVLSDNLNMFKRNLNFFGKIRILNMKKK